MDRNQEIPVTKEMFSTAKQTIALQTRLILGREALNPNKLDLGKITNDSLQDISQETYKKLNTASTNERTDYWQKKSIDDPSLNSYENQMKSWTSDVVKFMNNEEGFKEENALVLYDLYFTGEGKISGIDKFVEDIIAGHTTQDGNLNFEQLAQELPRIKKLANVFGGNSSELVETSILAKTKLTNPEKKQELITQSNEETATAQTPLPRLNYLNPDEERLLKWLDQNAATDIKIDRPELSPKPIIPENLTTELAKKSPELFKKALLEKIRIENPKMFSIWELLCRNNRTSIDQLKINPDTWFSESDNKDGIILGTAPMEKDSKYAIIFEDSKLNYEDEVIYRFAHEMSHKLVHYLAETKNQKSEFNYLLSTLYDLRSQHDNKGFSSLGSLGLYKNKGPQIQAQEDLTEMVNMYIQDPDYLKSFFNFLSDERYSEIRTKYGLVRLSPETVKVLFETIERGLKPLEDELNFETQDVDFTVSYEQNRKATDQFISVLRDPKHLKANPNWPTFLVHDYGFVFDSNNGGTIPNSELLATRYRLPFATYSNHLIPEVSHANLIIRGPHLDTQDNRWKINIYDPYQSNIREEILDDVHNQQEALAKISYNKLWEREYLQNNEDISFTNDPELRPYLDTLVNAKLAPFQRDMINCYPYCFFVGSMLNALKPEQTEFKTQGIAQFAKDYHLNLIDRNGVLKSLRQHA